jgi:methylated-DNA-[protein]-cysteine S-methyltransferase
MEPQGHRHAVRVRTPAGTIEVLARDADEAAALRPRLRAWMRGATDDFRDVPLPEGTDFQRRCWRACRRIPRGEVRTYGWLAAAAGRPGAARAAGQAMRRNPMPIVVPCHRVVGSGGWMGGYSGESGERTGGIARKRFLLQREAAKADVPSRVRKSRVRPFPAPTPHATERRRT